MADHQVQFEGWGNYQYGAGTWGDNYSGLAAVTASQGTETPEGRIYPTGQSATVGLGKENILVLLSPAGQVLTISEGEEDLEVRFFPTGDAVTTEQGTELTAVIMSPTGQNITTGQGLVDAINIYSVSGLSATVALGSEVPVIALLPDGWELSMRLNESWSPPYTVNNVDIWDVVDEGTVNSWNEPSTSTNNESWS